MQITAEEELMYGVMKAIYDSGISIDFKSKRTIKPAGKNDHRINPRTSLAFYDKYLMTVTEEACYFRIGDRKMNVLVHQY